MRPPPVSETNQWSFRLLKPSAMPTVRNPGRLRNPIDAFIQGKLKSNGLEFSPDADNVTLMCRVYLALTEGKWRYRDYVIQCLNDDVPYDQFLLEQLAGEEMKSTIGAQPMQCDRKPCDA